MEFHSAVNNLEEKNKESPTMSVTGRKRESVDSVDMNMDLELKVLQIFPLEIWECIFNNLESVKDIKSCREVSMNWSNILNSRRSEWVMEEVFPLISDFMSKNEILAQRLVCRRWRYAVDSYLCNGQHEKSENFQESRIGYTFPSKLIQVDFGSWRGDEKPLQKFLDDMSYHPHSTNPFIARSLRVCVRNTSQTFLKFLQTFGRFLENLEVYFEFAEIAFQYWQYTDIHVQYICHCLRNLQNLKRLKIFYVVYENRTCFAKVPVPIKGIDKAAVDEYLRTNRIPMPPNLERLGSRMESWYDDGAFELAFCKAGSKAKRHTVYERAYNGPNDRSWNAYIAEYKHIKCDFSDIFRFDA